MGRNNVAAAAIWRSLPKYPVATPSLSGPDDTEVWLRARAQYDVWARAGQVVPFETYKVAKRGPLGLAIKAESARVAPQGRPIDLLMLWGTAVRLVAWAQANTRETNTAVLARFAVEGAYDLQIRLVVGSTLTAAVAPDAWWWNGLRQSHCLDTRGDGYQPALRGADPQRLREQGLDIAALLRAGHVAEPSWPVRRTHLWMMDALRPPLVALQFAAWLIRREVGHVQRVLAVELGHSISAQALSCWLPESRVEAHSMFTRSRDVRRAPAVVLGVPCMRLLAWAVAATDPNIVFRRTDVDRFEQGRFTAPSDHVQPFVESAAQAVAPGGILVLVADVEDGVHHQANDAIRKLGFVPVTVEADGVARDLVDQAVFTHFPPPAWRPFGALAPTDRLVSAWRRPS